MFKDHVGLIVGCIVMLIMALLMPLLVFTVTGEAFDGIKLFTAWSQAFTLNFLVCMFIPSMDWGMKLCRKLKLEKGSWKEYLVSNAVLALINVTLMSLGLTYINVGIGPMFFKAWITVYPLVLFIGYAIAVVIGKIAEKYAIYVVTKAKAQA